MDTTIAAKEPIDARIRTIRGHKVLLDSDLAVLYGVETKVLNQAARRHWDRFPEDFMFRLTDEEWLNLRSQFVTSSYGGRRYLPLDFTEQGVAMLSSVLNSPRAIQVNIEVMRTFVRLRRMIETSAELSERLDTLESKFDEQFRIVFQAIRELMVEAESPKRKIGFRVREKRKAYRIAGS